MYPPAVAQRLADVSLLVFSSCVTSQVRISFSKNGTPCADALPRVCDVLLLPSSRGQSTRGRFTIDRRSIGRLTFRLAVYHLTEHVDTKGLQKPLHQPKLQLEIQPSLSSSIDLQPRVQPVIDVPTFSAAVRDRPVPCRTALKFERTDAMKHTLNDHEQSHLRIHQDVHTTRSITMYASSFHLLRSRRDCLPPAAFPFWVLSSTSLQDQQCWFSGMLVKSQCFLLDFLLHSEQLDLKMLQSSATLARCDSNASARVRQDRQPESFQNGQAVQAVR